jgi:hypothetical protein
MEHLLRILCGCELLDKGLFSWKWNPLENLNSKERAEVDGLKATRDAQMVGSGILTPEQAARRLSAEENGDYSGIMFDADAPAPDDFGLGDEEDFDEAKHPRASNGEFAKTSGSAKTEHSEKSKAQPIELKEDGIGESKKNAALAAIKNLGDPGRMLTIIFKKQPGKTEGQYFPKEGVIEIDPDLSEIKIKEAIYHEVGHAITLSAFDFENKARMQEMKNYLRKNKVKDLTIYGKKNPEELLAEIFRVSKANIKYNKFDGRLLSGLDKAHIDFFNKFSHGEKLAYPDK